LLAYKRGIESTDSWQEYRIVILLGGQVILGHNTFCAMTIRLNQAHMVLKATRVGNSFLFDAQINVRLVAKVKKYSCQICMPNISPGMMIMALQNHDTNSTML
jgi:hypothetical protein